MTSRIARNAARCRVCGDEIESKHRHDMKFCTCGEIFVDGGKEYLRRGSLTDPDNFISLSLSVVAVPTEETP